MKCIAKPIYNSNHFKQFNEKYDISILNNYNNNQNNNNNIHDRKQIQLSYSMLDFFNYFNKKEKIEE